MQNSVYFQNNPVAERMSRSKFPLSHKWSGTFNTGYLIPIWSYGDVLPGDTFKVGGSFVLRSTTPMAPVMDDAWIDIYFFFTPHKKLLSRSYMSPSVLDANHSFDAFIGAQDSLLNMPTPSDVVIPKFNVTLDGTDGSFADDFAHSLVDYLGLSMEGVLIDDPTKYKQTYDISCLEPLAYYAVWNEWFRDPSTMNPVVFSVSSGYVQLSRDGTNFGIESTDSILPVCRFHGYFGSALPWPQRGASVQLPLGDVAPVFTGDQHLTTYTDSNKAPLKFADPANNGVVKNRNLMVGANAQLTSGSTATESGFGNLAPTNLWVDLSEAVAASVNNLRSNIAAQRWLEALARGGNRIGEITNTMFGVTPHDYADDRPEYLGGSKIRIGMTQVNNTAGTNVSTSTQQSIGSTGAFSLTTDSRPYFVKSFDTWGTITSVCCVRVGDTFSQGIPRRYQRFKRLDLYWPQFAHIGEQPILNKEIYYNGKVGDADQAAIDNGVFGYQEAWAEYRFENDIVCGFARPGAGYDYFNYSNRFTGSAPLLKTYLDASHQIANVDRTLQVSSQTAGFQWLLNFYFDVETTRVMPLYSYPGLMDHY